MGFVLICPCGGREDLQVEDGARCHPRAGMEEEGHRCETAARSTTERKSVTRVTGETVTHHSTQKPLRQTLTKLSILNSKHGSSESQ